MNGVDEMTLEIDGNIFKSHDDISDVALFLGRVFCSLCKVLSMNKIKEYEQILSLFLDFENGVTLYDVIKIVPQAGTCMTLRLVSEIQLHFNPTTLIRQ